MVTELNSYLVSPVTRQGEITKKEKQHEVAFLHRAWPANEWQPDALARKSEFFGDFPR